MTEVSFSLYMLNENTCSYSLKGIHIYIYTYDYICVYTYIFIYIYIPYWLFPIGYSLFRLLLGLRRASHRGSSSRLPAACRAAAAGCAARSRASSSVELPKKGSIAIHPKNFLKGHHRGIGRQYNCPIRH